MYQMVIENKAKKHAQILLYGTWHLTSALQTLKGSIYSSVLLLLRNRYYRQTWILHWLLLRIKYLFLWVRTLSHQFTDQTYVSFLLLPYNKSPQLWHLKTTHSHHLSFQELGVKAPSFWDPPWLFFEASANIMGGLPSLSLAVSIFWMIRTLKCPAVRIGLTVFFYDNKWISFRKVMITF